MNLGAIALAIVLTGAFVWYRAFDGDFDNGYLINSDSMLLPQIYWNMTVRLGGWFSHQQARVIGLFPDQILHHFLFRVFGNFRVVSPSMVMVLLLSQISFASISVWRSSRVEFHAALVVTSLVFVTACLATLGWPLHTQMAGLLDHGGGFAVSLAMALLLGRRSWDPLVLALVLIGCLSDTLFVTMAVLPWVAARLFADWPERRWGAVRSVLPFVAAAALGVAAQTLVFHQKAVDLRPQTILRSLAEFLRQSSQDPRLAVFVVICLAAVIHLILNARRRRTSLFESHMVDVYAVSAMLLSLSATGAFFIDFASVRYGWPAAGWPLIVLARVLSERVSPRAVVLAGVVGAAVAGALVLRHGGRPPFLDWHDPEELCVARVVREEGLHAGLAGFWHTKRLVVSSDHTLKIEQVSSRGLPEVWGNDPYWYLHDHRRADGGVRYDFMLTADQDLLSVVASYGPPETVRRCVGTDIWIWRDDHALDLPFKKMAADFVASLGRASDGRAAPP